MKDAVTLIRDHENVRLKVYHDTLGHATIGWGRCLECEGITREEADMLLANDKARIDHELAQLPWYAALDPARQAVIVDMAYNLGVEGVLGFKSMIARIEAQDWDGAAFAMHHSKWAHQVGRRSFEDAQIMRSGAG